MKHAKKFIFILKIIVLVASFGFIFLKLLNEKQISQLVEVLKGFDSGKIVLLCFIIVLMFFNWMTEAVKWKLLIQKIESISILKSFKAILSGVTISIFTPNRTGEFAGRILNLERDNRIQSVFATFTGNIAQLVTTCIFGLTAFIFLPYYFSAVYIDSLYTPQWISYVGIVLLVTIILLYFNLALFEKPVNRINFVKKYHRYYSHFFSYNRNHLLKFLLLSILRYLFFSLQYVLLLWVFEVNISASQAFMATFLIYFILTAFPTIALSEIGIRGSISIYILENLTENLSAVFLASTSLWIINLALPALIGSLIIYRSKI